MTTVIIVPGLMGTRLFLEQANAREIDVWYNPKRTFLLGPEDFGLAPDGVNPASYATGPLEAGGDAGFGVYHPAIRTISEANLEAFFFGYDWRMSIVDSGVLLANHIIEKYQGEAFYVLAYSLGGLVARVAYDKLTGDQAKANWLRTLYVGVPHGGCMDSVSSLCSGIATFPLLYYFAISAGASLTRLASLNWRQTNISDRFAKVIATWPSLYELFPSFQPTWLGIQPNISQAWTLANLTKWNPHATQTRLDRALATQVYLEALLSQAQPPFDQVVSVGTDTAQGVQSFSKLALAEGYAFGLLGDGVVPSARAQIGGGNVLTTDGKHGNLMSTFQVTQRLKGMLTVGLPGPAVLRDPDSLKPPVFVAPPGLTVETPPRPFPGIQVVGDP